MPRRLICTVLILPSLLALTSCQDVPDMPTDPGVPDGYVQLRVHANVALTNVRSLTLEVSSDSTTDPIIANFSVRNGAADGKLTVPLGTPLRISGRATDPSGAETHGGSVTVELPEIDAPTVALTLLPLQRRGHDRGGSRRIKVKIGAVVLVVTPSINNLVLGQSGRFTAQFLDPEGNEVKGQVEWGSFDISKAVINKKGVVTAVDFGEAEIVAVGSGLAGSAWVRVYSALGLAEALASDAFDAWHEVLHYVGPTMFISSAAAEHVSPWTNAGMQYYSRIPRVSTGNAPGDSAVSNLTHAWHSSYQAISTVRDLLSLIEGEGVAPGASGLRLRAFSKFMQGLAYGAIALLYDSGFVYDETMDHDMVRLQGYSDVMSKALDYFAEAATLAGSGSFTIPATWMSQDVSSDELVRLAHSEMARMRANVARTPAERAAVDWAAVASDVGDGVTEDWDIYSQCFPHVFCDEGIFYRLYPGWQMQNNWVAGMADVSGAYQAWLSTPLLDKQPFIIITPDTRWPQGPDEVTQLANPGEYYTVTTGTLRIWHHPERGTWRWSYYYQTKEPFFAHAQNGVGELPQVTVREGKALLAEKAYRDGDMTAVAAFVNETRTLHGLAATDAAGTNTDCVPRLPDGSCGDLWEMFKWEKRLETQFAGPLRIGWYFDGRGWGDLMEGTLLQLPVPYDVMQGLGRPPYDFGGVGGTWGAPVGTYGY